MPDHDWFLWITILFQISRGNTDSRNQTTTNMKTHLDRKHSKELKEIAAKEQPAEPSNESTIDAGTETRKRGSGNYTELFSLCPQKRRKELFQSTIHDWVEAKTMLHFGSERAQRLHKSIFEMLIMDNQPFYEVMKPGLWLNIFFTLVSKYTWSEVEWGLVSVHATIDHVDLNSIVVIWHG